MKRTQKITIGALSAVACSIWLVVLSIASQTYRSWSQQPLGPTLVYSTAWELPATWTASPTLQQPATALTPTLAFETETPTLPWLACNNLPAMIILAIGTDVRPGEHRTGLSDVMRAVRVDFRGQRMTTLEFPRDLWVQISDPEIELKLGTDHQKLNTAWDADFDTLGATSRNFSLMPGLHRHYRGLLIRSPAAANK